MINAKVITKIEKSEQNCRPLVCMIPVPKQPKPRCQLENYWPWCEGWQVVEEGKTWKVINEQEVMLLANLE